MKNAPGIFFLLNFCCIQHVKTTKKDNKRKRRSKKQRNGSSRIPSGYEIMTNKTQSNTNIKHTRSKPQSTVERKYSLGQRLLRRPHGLFCPKFNFFWLCF